MTCATDEGASVYVCVWKGGGVIVKKQDGIRVIKTRPLCYGHYSYDTDFIKRGRVSIYITSNDHLAFLTPPTLRSHYPGDLSDVCFLNQIVIFNVTNIYDWTGIIWNIFNAREMFSEIKSNVIFVLAPQWFRCQGVDYSLPALNFAGTLEWKVGS